MQNLKRNIILTFIFAFTIYIFLAFYSDFDSLYYSLEQFQLPNFILVFFFSLIGIFIKFYRWHYLLLVSKIKIDFKNSLLVFGTGLIMGITPGKWGEVFKSYLLKKDFDIELVKSLPIIFAERMSEFLTLIFLSILTLFFLNQYQTFLFVLIIFFVVTILFLTNKSVLQLFLKYLSKVKFLKIDASKTRSILASQKIIINPILYIISIFAWLFEFFCFYIILSNFINDISVFKSVTLYSFAILFGSISMLPGGLGATEGSLTFLLFQNGILKNDAVAVTVLIRFFTLWLSVFIGVLSSVIYFKRRIVK
ncbi:MAG: flippase-like domain-containing protein [Ignavibacteriales bacterium]|nr:flippase-like domain-containing protein [Ignavibacteriales bacterium]